MVFNLVKSTEMDGAVNNVISMLCSFIQFATKPKQDDNCILQTRKL